MDLRGCCNHPERSRTRAVVSKEEEDGTNLRETEEVESAGLVGSSVAEGWVKNAS